jgi:enoyl-CoA hydratase
VSAHEAERIGLVNFVVPDEELDVRALEFAARLAAAAPLAVQYTKQAMNKLVKSAVETAFDAALALEMLTFHSRDHREALLALQERRPPLFVGR